MKYLNASNKAAENNWDMNDMKIWDIWLKNVNVGEPVICITASEKTELWTVLLKLDTLTMKGVNNNVYKVH